MKNWIKAILTSIIVVGAKTVFWGAIIFGILCVLTFMPDIIVKIGALLVMLAFFGMCILAVILTFLESVKDRKERYDRADEWRKNNGSDF